MSKKELNLYSKVCKAYDKAIITWKTGTKEELEKSINTLNKLRTKFYELTGNNTEILEIKI